MSSIIEGYNYDIFISYRQKDNKGDMWVSEFVEALKTELESTFKEEISVYFDVNPHDGLLETHDVDESLKEKLKCLVFIPVISRTYCDQKSFAWEHEFKVFLEAALKDKYGLRVKLPGGNVTNRVLPVQIHELDPEDKKLVEGELGGHLRGIEFIYKESGVARPLTSKDNEDKNLNKTSYRNQINKVALALREIITAIKKYNPEQTEVKNEGIKPLIISQKNRKTMFITGTILALFLLAVGLFLARKLFKPGEEIEKSIAVLPFYNDSPDPENEYFCNGMMDEILNQLQKIGDLKVKARTSSEKYRNPNKDIKVIGRELEVSLILEGSVRKTGDDIRITAQLIDARTGDHLWSEIYDGKYTTKIFDFQSTVAKKVASSLNVVISPQEEKRIDTKPTKEILAYDLASRGHEMIRKYRFTRDSNYFKMALNFCDQALKIDSAYAGAIELKGLAYAETGNSDSAMYYYRKANKADPSLSLGGIGRVFWIINQPDSALKYVQRRLDQAPNNCWSNLLMGQLYSRGKNDIINGLPYFQRAYDNDGESEPEININIASEYLNIGDFQKASKYSRKALFLRSECSLLQYYCLMLFAQGNYDEALPSLDSVCVITPCEQICNMARFNIYLFNKEFEKAEESFKKAANGGYEKNDFEDIFIACLYNETGRRKEALSIVNRSIELNEDMLKENMSNWQLSFLSLKLACAYAVLDDNNNAIRYLSEYELLGNFQYFFILRRFPGFDELWYNPDFKAIINRIEDRQAFLRAQVKELEQRGEITL